MMIPVTKPFLPPVEKYQKYIEGIYQRQWLTNNGPLVNELELRLKEYLGLKHLLYVSNGTIALQLAIKALGLKGEIITTPFSYVATTSSIVWEGCTPVFVDIDKATFNIDPTKIEAAITPKTSAILATHCFGNACDIDAIQAIAEQHQLKVIYDAAHCFGTTYKDRCIFEYGDISTTSLHATKLMHSIEGGLVVTKDPELVKRMAYMRNFGHDGPEKFNGVGINGKNSEFHAAMGLCVLDDFPTILETRKNQWELYYNRLKSKDPVLMNILPLCKFNFAYFPVVFGSEEILQRVKTSMENKNIFPRRYFYPSLSKLGYIVSGPTNISDKISSSILCLPLYHTLTKEEQDFILRIILRVLNN